MTIVRKPEKAENFIEKAKTNQQVSVSKKQKSKSVGTKGIRMTFYMDQETYYDWQKYKLDQLALGKKTTFQATVERLLKRELKK